MLPANLRKQLDIAKKIIENKDILPLYERVKIWELFGEYINRIDESVKLKALDYFIGHKRRTILQKKCVEKVLFLWSKRMPDDEIVQGTLDIVSEYLKRGYPPIPPNIGDTAQGEVLRLCNNEYVNEDYIGLVGRACYSVLMDSIFDTNDWELENAYKLEDKLDEYGHADYFSSIAYSETGSMEIDNRRLKEFWFWYIKTAVPLAYELIED